MSSTRPKYSYATKQAVPRAYAAQKKRNNRGVSPKRSPDKVAMEFTGVKSRQTIWRWRHTNQSPRAIAERRSRAGRPPALNEIAEFLIIGYALYLRSESQAVPAKILIDFAAAHLKKTINKSQVSKLLQKHGWSSRRSLKRNSRQLDGEVADQSVDFIVELRGLGIDTKNWYVMDEAGIWSNTVPRRAYHPRSGYATLDILRSD